MSSGQRQRQINAASNEKVVPFEPRLRERQQKRRIEEALSKQIDSGWLLADPATLPGAELCVYLLDAENGTALAFGNSIAELTASTAGKWSDLILAWDVVADPHLLCDKTHLEVTSELARRAINSAQVLPDLSVQDGQRIHLILVLDRNKLDSPCTVVPAVSYAEMLNPESVRAIVDAWLEQR